MAAKRPPRRTTKGQRQREGAPAVVEDPSLPRMGELEIAPRRIGRRIETMPAEPKLYRGSKNLMEPVPRSRRGKAPGKADAVYGDQEEQLVKGSKGRSSTTEMPGYLRFQIRVEGRELSVVAAKYVEGPLIQPDTIHAGLSYEVKVGNRRVAVGDVAEPEWRSYPDPLGRQGLERHHITRPETYEFSVRVSADELSREKLAETKVTLRSWAGRGPGEMLEMNTVTKEPKGAVTTIGVLRGINLDQLPKTTQTELRRALR